MTVDSPMFDAKAVFPLEKKQADLVRHQHHYFEQASGSKQSTIQ